MAEQGTKRQPPPPRVIRHERPGAPPLRVTDPALRALLQELRRARSMEAREIARRCGLDPDTPDDEAA